MTPPGPPFWGELCGLKRQMKSDWLKVPYCTVRTVLYGTVRYGSVQFVHCTVQCQFPYLYRTGTVRRYRTVYLHLIFVGTRQEQPSLLAAVFF